MATRHERYDDMFKTAVEKRLGERPGSSTRPRNSTGPDPACSGRCARERARRRKRPLAASLTLLSVILSLRQPAGAIAGEVASVSPLELIASTAT